MTQTTYSLPQDLLDKVNALCGPALYHAMGVAWKKNDMKWVHTLLIRAQFINRNRFGSWEQARVNVDHLDIDKHFQLNKAISLEPVLGYPCQVSTYGTEDKIKTQFISLTRKDGPVYIRHLIKDGKIIF